MSGHSHFSSIKYKKAIADAKRGKIFSKLSRQISLTAREKGGNPETNSALKLAIEKAKEFNMPKDNIERAIKKGIGELGNEKLEEVLFEAYGPGGIAIIIEGITDNKNRTLGEIKQILTQRGGKLIKGGGIRWMFDRRGCIIIDLKLQIGDLQNKEKIGLKAIEAGAEDIYWRGNLLDVYTKPEELEKIKEKVEEKGIKTESASLDWVAKEMVTLPDKEACEKLFEALDENDAIQEIYSNLRD